jgi:hypothetical protein
MARVFGKLAIELPPSLIAGTIDTTQLVLHHRGGGQGEAFAACLVPIESVRSLGCLAEHVWRR